MIAFKDTYESRKKEIEEFIELMKFLEKKEFSKKDDISEFSSFFYQGEDRISLTYQSLINILKSNVSLMIYNIIEYTITNLMDSIYDEIRIHGLTYVDVNECIRALWRKNILKSTNDPNANFNTFLRKNEEIIDNIIDNVTLDIHSRSSLPAGNLDGISIRQTFESHGIMISTNSRNYRPDILNSIKTQRNNLAHGSVSFTDAVRMDAISDIESNEKFVISFLEELIETVIDYIDHEMYKVNSSKIV
ncbi:MAE_28990/MAE_18760 family HEPN-like nuclease [Clostridium sp. Marseille-P2415]|uniref:MAE_28990/MAE_18760 family HEPN-like nuclease n=1 Tax=Clostridium sp. Marseille-P2415 TaxID=1805471 RepID=UPI0009884101|nr:MAE_28990/MAE_18760 family HEPN-like nuclease [Clostridium sp. Marseille-P2415]